MRGRRPAGPGRAGGRVLAALPATGREVRRPRVLAGGSGWEWKNPGEGEEEEGARRQSAGGRAGAERGEPREGAGRCGGAVGRPALPGVGGGGAPSPAPGRRAPSRVRRGGRDTPPGARAAVGRAARACEGREAGTRPWPRRARGRHSLKGAGRRQRRVSLGGARIMALCSSFARLLRKQAGAGLQLPKQAHSVALVGAPLSRGQVGIAAGAGGGVRRPPPRRGGRRAPQLLGSLPLPFLPSAGLGYLPAGSAG